MIGNGELRLRGRVLSPGVAIGAAYFIRQDHEEITQRSLEAAEVPSEIGRYRDALDASRTDIRSLLDRLETEEAYEGIAILETHLTLLDDPLLSSEIESGIEAKGVAAEALFQDALQQIRNRFDRLNDSFFRERMLDLDDIARRVLAHLGWGRANQFAQAPLGAIIFSRELFPTDTAEAHREQVGAFITQFGGDTSHSAIMAKAKGIPYVAQIDYTPLKAVEELKCVIVDGRSGEVIVNPTPPTLSKYEEAKRQLAIHLKRVEEVCTLPIETKDGYPVQLTANVEMIHEAERVMRFGGQGVGLFRSEYIICRSPHSSPQTFPSEEEQFRIYKRIAEAVGKEGFVAIRTFDVGGDKFRELHRVRNEENPFLGCRAIRLMLKEHDAFRSQLRAILRSSHFGAVRILFPMVSGLSELLEAKEYVRQAKEELRERGEPFDEEISIGCMIEVPSAAVTSDLLARECDFFSIGTNDLVQYSLAVDRENQAMSYLYTPAHPAVLRLIKMVVSAGRCYALPVNLCGEMAADPRFIALLLGLGVQGFSVATRFLPIIKRAIRQTVLGDAMQLAEEVMQLPTALDILDTLIADYQRRLVP